MDPNATLSAMVESLDGGNFETAREYARNLADWLIGGGFPPTGCTLDETCQLCAKVIMDTEAVTPADTCIGE